MKNLFSIITIIGSLIGALLLFTSFAMDSAPQQGATAAIAVGLAVIPYCITRTIQMLTDNSEDALHRIHHESHVSRQAASFGDEASSVAGDSMRESATRQQKELAPAPTNHTTPQPDQVLHYTP